MKYIFRTIAITALLFAVGCGGRQEQESAEPEAAEVPAHDIRFGIIADNYRTEEGEVANGETLGKILSRYGVSAATVDMLDKASKDIFPLRQIRAGRPYTAFIATDSLNAGRLDYMVYEKDLTDYVVFGFRNDTVSVTTGLSTVG